MANDDDNGNSPPSPSSLPDPVESAAAGESSQFPPSLPSFDTLVGSIPSDLDSDTLLPHPEPRPRRRNTRYDPTLPTAGMGIMHPVFNNPDRTTLESPGASSSSRTGSHTPRLPPLATAAPALLSPLSLRVPSMDRHGGVGGDESVGASTPGDRTIEFSRDVAGTSRPSRQSDESLSSHKEGSPSSSPERHRANTVFTRPIIPYVIPSSGAAQAPPPEANVSPPLSSSSPTFQLCWDRAPPRTYRACVQCRARKVKCDTAPGQDTCRRCAERGLKCSEAIAISPLLVHSPTASGMGTQPKKGQRGRPRKNSTSRRAAGPTPPPWEKSGEFDDDDKAQASASPGDELGSREGEERTENTIASPSETQITQLLTRQFDHTPPPPRLNIITAHDSISFPKQEELHSPATRMRRESFSRSQGTSSHPYARENQPRDTELPHRSYAIQRHEQERRYREGIPPLPTTDYYEVAAPRQSNPRRALPPTRRLGPEATLDAHRRNSAGMIPSPDSDQPPRTTLLMRNPGSGLGPIRTRRNTLAHHPFLPPPQPTSGTLPGHDRRRSGPSTSSEWAIGRQIRSGRQNPEADVGAPSSWRTSSSRPVGETRFRQSLDNTTVLPTSSGEEDAEMMEDRSHSPTSNV